MGPAERERVLERLRAICLGLPEVERAAEPRRADVLRPRQAPFLMVLTDHHGDGRFAIWCAAGEGMQQMLVDADPERFFVPPYVGHRGWLGVRLDRGLDWNELAGIVEDAYAEIAPAKLVEAAPRAPRRRLDRARPGYTGRKTYGGAMASTWSVLRQSCKPRFPVGLVKQPEPT